MSNADYARRVDLLRSISAGAAVFVAGLGALVLLGWGLRFPLLTTFHPAFISMKANTAVGFMVAALALWLLQSQRAESRAARSAAWAGAALVAGLGVLTLAEYAGGGNLGIDQLLVREPAGALRTVVPGRMAPNTAFSFVLIGLGLLLLEVRTRGGQRPVVWLAAAIGLVAGLAIAGYIYDTPFFSSLRPQANAMAIPTALAGLGMAVGLLLARPGPRLVAVLFAEDHDNALIRRFLVPVLMAPLLLDVMLLTGQRAGFYGGHVAAAAHAVLMTALLLGLVLTMTGASERRAAESTEPDPSGAAARRKSRPWLHATPGRGWKGYVAAVLFVAAATGIRLAALQMLGLRAAFITFYPAVMLAALYGGFPAGLLATVLSGAAADYFWIEPRGQFGVADPADWLSLGIFLLSGTMISGLAEAMHRARARAHGAELQASVAAVHERELATKARLAAIVESSDDAIISKDLTGVIQSWNAGAEQMFGYRAGEIIGQPIARLIPSELQPREREIIQRVAAGEQVRHYDTVRLTKEGRRLDVSLTISPLRDAAGRIIGASKIVRDITERKRSELALWESERRYRSLFENVQEGFYLAQMVGDADAQPVDFTYLDINPAFERMMGRPREQLVGRTAKEVIPALKPEWLAIFNQVQQTGQPARHDSFSEALHRHFEAVIFRPAAGCFAVLVSDVTVAKQAEAFLRQAHEELEQRVLHRTAELRASEQRYRTLFESMDEGFCVVEMIYGPDGQAADYRFVEINPAFAKHTGLDQALGRTIRELVPDIEAHWLQIYGWVALKGEAIRFQNFAAALQRWFDVYAFRLGGPGSARVAVLFTDITERKRVEEALQQATAALEQRVVERTAEAAEGAERLRLALRAADLGVFEWDVAADRADWGNARMREIIGQGPDEGALSRREMVSEIVHPEDVAVFEAALAEAMHPGQSCHVVFRIRRRNDGEVRWVEITGRFEHMPDGSRPRRLIAVVQDITERHRVEEALRLAKEEWERTFQAVPDLIAVLDANHRVLRTNQAMADRLHVQPDQCIGLYCYEHVHGAACPPDSCPHAQTLRDGRPHTAEVHEPRLGGDFLVTTTPLFDSSGALTGTVHVARDITDRKRAEESLRAKNAELERFNKLMVGRELRMIELKREINALCAQAGQPPRYAPAD